MNRKIVRCPLPNVITTAVKKMQNNDQNELEMAKNSLAYDINQGWMDY